MLPTGPIRRLGYTGLYRRSFQGTWFSYLLVDRPLTYQAHAQRVVIMAGNEDLILADQFISQQDNAALAHSLARPGLPGDPKWPTAQQRALARYWALSRTSPGGKGKHPGETCEVTPEIV